MLGIGLGARPRPRRLTARARIERLERDIKCLTEENQDLKRSIVATQKKVNSVQVILNGLVRMVEERRSTEGGNGKCAG